MLDVLVIGAGVSGLACARRLDSGGARVRVLDKGRGVGGRCATRRVEQQVVDHGAAFYHGRDPDFLEQLATVEATPVEGWPRVVVGEGSPCQPRAFGEGEHRLAFREGMTAFPKHLARGLDVELGVRVRELAPGPRGDVHARCDHGREYRANVVCLALPAPQALDLLLGVKGGSRELEAGLSLLRGVSSVRCLTVLAGYDGSVPILPWEVAYPEDSRILQLASVDSSKREDPRWTVIVLQALPCWSRGSWDRGDDEWCAQMLSEAASRYGDWIERPGWVQTHRWRFARLGGGGDLTGPPILALPGGSRAALCGEAFARGGGVQAAWRSGVTLAGRLLGDG